MTIKELYLIAGGNVEEVKSRLISEENVARFAIKFLSDDSFAKLTEAMADRDIDNAFVAAHTLKGTSQNLGFVTLGQSAAELTEILRRRTFDNAEPAFAKVKADYAALTAAIEQFAKN